MEFETIYENEYIRICSKSKDLYIETFKQGFSHDQLNEVFITHPEIEAVNFTVMKNALMQAPKSMEKFGNFKERIVIQTIENDLKATVVFNVPKANLSLGNRMNLKEELMTALSAKGIVFGIKEDLLQGEIIGGKKYTVAEGTPAVNGNDAIIRMFEIKEIKPEVFEENKVDYYELTLITTVEDNAWLGERIEATDGTPGQSVKGMPLLPVRGKTFPLLYDKKSVYELLEGNKTVLYSKEYGAVFYQEGKVAIMNPLVIEGDIGPKTGNVIFDGYVIINGTVCDGFYVEATKDIEIKGELGLGSVKGIVSTGGSIYIKGGVLSKGHTEIKAVKNIYTKFIDNVDVQCEESAHIGYYCFNSKIKAREVIFDSMKGQVIGGEIVAKTKVVVPILGCELEKKTTVNVTGFDRKVVQKDIDTTLAQLESLKKELQNTKESVAYMDKQAELSNYQVKRRFDEVERIEAIKIQIKELDAKRRAFLSYMETRGDGEIRITKKIFPNCTLTIKKNMIDISAPTLNTTFFVVDGKLKQV